MTDLEKLFNEISLQLKEESKKYKKLKICKYSFEISKVAILSIATGFHLLNICYFINNFNSCYRYNKTYSKC